MTKLQPAVMNLQFGLTGAAGATEYFIDLSQAASIVNRRFYRQGLNWAVAGMTVQFESSSTSVAGNFNIYTLPTTWVCSNAWHKMFAAWHRQQREALEDGDQESVLARFNDFKIFMNQDHVSAFVTNDSDLNATNLIPFDGNGDLFTTGEWQPSQIVLPNREEDGPGGPLINPLEQYLHMVGSIGQDSSASRGIISAYAFSRSTPQSPDPSVPTNVTNDEYNILRNMFDVGNDNTEILDNAIRTNDELPYSKDLYPGAYGNAGDLQLLSNHKITPTTVGNRVSILGSNIPCGLIKVLSEPDVDAVLTVHLVPGNHRGYLAEPMQDM